MNLMAGVFPLQDYQSFSPLSIETNRWEVQVSSLHVQDATKHECSVNRNGGAPPFVDSRALHSHWQKIVVIYQPRQDQMYECRAGK